MSSDSADGTPCWLCIVKKLEAAARPYCAAFVVDAETRRVVASAPILRWARGKAGRDVVESLRRAGHTVTIMGDARLRERADGAE